MKRKKCPYCGKRISYTSGLASRRKGEFICTCCGKESRVVIDKKIYAFFAVAVVISVCIMAFWIIAGLISNLWGVVLVAVPLIIFMLTTPRFLKYMPLKKYKKSMEAKKAGRVYSDNLTDDGGDDFIPGVPLTENTGFEINTDVFNHIKEERKAARVQLQQENGEASQEETKNTAGGYVPIIDDVSENHASSSDAPLKKIHSDSERSYERQRHYIPVSSDSKAEADRKKPDSNRYSANRKF